MGRRSNTEDRFTYRFVKNGRANEVHGDRDELLDTAVRHLNQATALPVHIRQGKRVVIDEFDILQAWSEKHL